MASAEQPAEGVTEIEATPEGQLSAEGASPSLTALQSIPSTIDQATMPPEVRRWLQSQPSVQRPSEDSSAQEPNSTDHGVPEERDAGSREGSNRGRSAKPSKPQSSKSTNNKNGRAGKKVREPEKNQTPTSGQAEPGDDSDSTLPSDATHLPEEEESGYEEDSDATSSPAPPNRERVSATAADKNPAKKPQVAIQPPKKTPTQGPAKNQAPQNPPGRKKRVPANAPVTTQNASETAPPPGQKSGLPATVSAITPTVVETAPPSGRKRRTAANASGIAAATTPNTGQTAPPPGQKKRTAAKAPRTAPATTTNASQTAPSTGRKRRAPANAPAAASTTTPSAGETAPPPKKKRRLTRAGRGK